MVIDALMEGAVSNSHLLFSCMFSMFMFMGFPGRAVVKNLLANAEDLDSISRSTRSPGERNGYPLQYSSLKNPMDRRSWQAEVHGIAKQ